jgi:hypothetical protein
MNGTIYHALAQKDIGKRRPMYTFVPEGMIKGGKLDATKYSASRWPSINCAANPTAVGSHLFPDITSPADPEECPEFIKELQKFAHKSKGSPTQPRMPGKAGWTSPT